MPLITTIIPTYKRPERLKKAIHSVLNQTFQDFELRIYDNASKDETAKIVEDFMRKDPRVKYHCHEYDIGAVENFQYGISRVDTPYFSVLSDDDILLPEFYETTLKGFEKHPDAAASIGAIIDIEDSGNIVGIILSSWPDKEYYPAPEGLLEMIGKDSNWDGILFKTELAHKVGPLDLEIKAMDVDFSFRVAARFPIVISKKHVGIFVSHATSYSRNRGLKLIFPGRLKMIENLKEIPNLSSHHKIEIEKRLLLDMQMLLFKHILKLIEKRYYDEARESLEVFKQYSNDTPKKRILELLLRSNRKSKTFHRTYILLFKALRYWKRYIRDNKGLWKHRKSMENFVNSVRESL